MKTQNLITMTIAVLLATACVTDRTRAFIPGIYVNSATGEYSTADDTLTIVPTDRDMYNIHRKTGFNVIRDGKEGKREYETEQWRAVYDRSTKILTETRGGKSITFYPDSNSLRVGTREYRKIN